MQHSLHTCLPADLDALVDDLGHQHRQEHIGENVESDRWQISWLNQIVN